MLGKRLLSYITETYLDEDEDEFDINTPLLELNIIDSSSLFDLVEWLRKETGSVIPLQEIAPHNFASVQAILNLVKRL